MTIKLAATAPPPPPRWGTLQEAAGHARVHPKTVRRWARDGRIHLYYAGPRVVRVDLNELDAMIRDGR